MPKILAAFFLWLFLCANAWAESRRALIIGNGGYLDTAVGYNKLGPLINPAADADAIAEALSRYGFRATVKKDLKNKRQFEGVVGGFARALPKDATALVYYSGHGIGADGRNWLLPTGEGYDTPADVTEKGVSAEWVLAKVAEQGPRRVILVLDACRDHMPLDQAAKGPGDEAFGSVPPPARELPGGTLIAYASSAGQVAWGDPADPLSLYTRRLIEALDTHASQSISRALEQVTARVYADSSNPANRDRFRTAQKPRFNYGLLETWCLSPQGCGTPVLPTVASSAPEHSPLPSVRIGTVLPEPVSIEGWSREKLAERRRRTAEALGIPERYEEDLGDGVKMPMVLVPGGRFRMGSPDGEGHSDEHPRHWVSVDPFYMAETELTQRQWRALMGDRDFAFEGDDKPAERVSWRDAQDFLTALGSQGRAGYRLPSEAQWEYAARAGSTGKYSWGDDFPVCERGANRGAVYGQCEGLGTEPVGFSAANAFGLHDLHGNVWEWTQDCYQGDYKRAPDDGSAWESGECKYRALRGGSGADTPGLLRAASRGGSTPDVRSGDLGFRVVRAAPSSATGH